MAYPPPGPPGAPMPPGTPGPFGPPGPPSRRKGPIIFLAVAGSFTLLVALAVTAFLVLPEDDEADTPRALASPVQFLRVIDFTAGACTGGGTPGPDGTGCYRLGTGTTIDRVARIEAIAPDETDPGWRILIKLELDDVREFAALTREIAAASPGTPQRRLAIVVDGRVLSAPEVQEALTTGDVQISGRFSERETEDLVRRITGTG